MIKSAVTEGIRFIPSNLLITKRPVERTADAGFNWMIFVDGSQRALHGVELTLQLI
jgi:hypothetical protein